METNSRAMFLVVYKPSDAWIAGLPVSQQSLREHGRFLLELYRQGSLKFAGPFSDDTGGAAVIVADDVIAANALILEDPAVVNKVFVYEIHPWTLVSWDSDLKT